MEGFLASVHVNCFMILELKRLRNNESLLLNMSPNLIRTLSLYDKTKFILVQCISHNNNQTEKHDA